MGNTCSAEGACFASDTRAPLDHKATVPDDHGPGGAINTPRPPTNRDAGAQQGGNATNGTGPAAGASADTAAGAGPAPAVAAAAAGPAAPNASNQATHPPPGPQEPKQFSKTFRILLLGAGESGKTTFTQQLSLIHNINQISDEERKRNTLQALHENIIQCMSATAANALRLGFAFSQEENEKLDAIKTALKLDRVFAEDVLQLWNTEVMQKSYQQKNKYWVLDTAEWLIGNVTRFAEDSYMPTREDIILSRRRTTGITEHTYIVDDTAFTIIDVGGQRAERRKWVQFFADVHCIVFFVSAIGFCKVLFEDRNTYQMKEALELFSATFRVPAPQTGPRIDNDWQDYVFETTPIHVVFNKMDMLESSLLKHNLSSCFPAYKAHNSPDPVMSFLQQIFTERVASIRAPPDFHRISATNEEDVHDIFSKISNFLVEKEKAGIALNMFMQIEKQRERDATSRGPPADMQRGQRGARQPAGGKGDADAEKKRNRQRMKRIQELMRDNP
jgi:GTPase SAR1 family protein